MELEIVRTRILESKIAQKIEMFQIKPPAEYPLIGFTQHFGVDPGVTNIGLAELGRNNYITAFQIEMIRKSDPVERVFDFYNIMSACFNSFNIPCFAVIEGSSYGAKYRQVELADIRTSSMFWFKHHGIKAMKVLPPLTIRKTVFMSGKIRAEKVWENIPSDCAAAISCAYASMHVENLQ